MRCFIMDRKSAIYQLRFGNREDFDSEKFSKEYQNYLDIVLKYEKKLEEKYGSDPEFHTIYNDYVIAVSNMNNNEVDMYYEEAFNLGLRLAAEAFIRGNS